MLKNATCVVVAFVGALAAPTSVNAAADVEVSDPVTVESVDAARPTFQLPFPCNQTWHASTYAGHRAIDWNDYPQDDGKSVVAGYSGTASTGYGPETGYYVTIDHGGGWRTRHLHLQAAGRATGHVDMGDRIGSVGGTGAATAPHLHWEQIHDGVAQATLYADGKRIEPGDTADPGAPVYTSRNCPSDPPPTPPGSASGSAVVSDGYLFSFTLGPDRDVQYRARSQGDNEWRDWRSLDTPPGVTITAAPTAITSDGYLFVTVIASNGQLYTRARGESDNEWRTWQARGAPATAALVGPTTAANSDGYLFVVATGTDGDIYYRARSQGDNEWRDWRSLDTPPGVTITAAPTAITSDGYLFVTVIASNGQLYTRARGESDNEWRTWQARGAPATAALVGPTTAANSDGYLFVVATGTDGDIYYRARSQGDNEWRDWRNLGTPVGHSTPESALLLDAPGEPA